MSSRPILLTRSHSVTTSTGLFFTVIITLPTTLVVINEAASPAVFERSRHATSRSLLCQRWSWLVPQYQTLSDYLSSLLLCGKASRLTALYIQ